MRHPTSSASSQLQSASAARCLPRLQPRVRDLARLVCAVALASSLAPSAEAQISGKAERMAQGFGSKIVSIDPSTTEVGRVTVRTKSAGFCAVTASFTTSLDTNERVTIGLSSSAASMGPWIHEYENETHIEQATSGFITQTFDVPADTPVKFFLNGATSDTVSIELTRIWVVCGVGAAQGLIGEPPVAQQHDNEEAHS